MKARRQDRAAGMRHTGAAVKGRGGAIGDLGPQTVREYLAGEWVEYVPTRFEVRHHRKEGDR